MQFTGKLVQLLPLQTGQGKNGPWKKQDIIVETEGQYPKKVCVSIWGDKADESVLKVGNSLKIDFDVESREFNGRWYTDIKAWKVEATGGTTFEHDAPPFTDAPPTDVENDLPF
jgi:hypothetical protein